MSKKITLEGLDHFKDKENAMIAGKPESTNTATVAHAVGEYFYWKGVLHIVTAAIAVGGTIQTNTNVKPAVLADDVGALKESFNDIAIEEPITSTDLTRNGFTINSSNKWIALSSQADAGLIAIPENTQKIIVKPKTGATSFFAFLKSTAASSQTTPDFSEEHPERIVAQASTKPVLSYDVSPDMLYFYAAITTSGGVAVYPDEVIFESTTDTTLTKNGKAADAKETGEALDAIRDITINLVDPKKIVSNSYVNVVHNNDGSITISTKSARSYAFANVPIGDIKPNINYVFSYETVSATEDAWVALFFTGTYKSNTSLGSGIRTGNGIGAKHCAVIYTSGYERNLRIYITGSTSAESTVTIKNIMVAEADYAIPYISYGVSANDKIARANVDGLHRQMLSWSKANVQASIRQFVNVKYTPLNKLPSQFGDFPAGEEIMGVPYSSARANDRLVGMHISLHTFLSAIHNPRSVLYTRYITHSNAKTFYGCVCSAFVDHVLHENINLTTSELWNWEKLTEIPITALDIGDILLTQGHAKIVYDISRDEYGRPTDITIAEAGEPVVKWENSRIWEQFYSSDISSGNYKAFRYSDIEGVGYTRELPVRGYLDETIEDVIYPDIMSEYGDEVAILEGENIVINVIDSTDYDTISVYIDGTLSQTITNLADFTISNATAGSYEIRMTGDDKETSTKFIVVNANCEYNQTTHILSFSSNNATPHAVFVYNSNPGNKYVPLTEEQLASGSVDLSDYANSTYPYVKVNFMTDYGVATWYSYDLHLWDYVT